MQILKLFNWNTRGKMLKHHELIMDQKIDQSFIQLVEA